MILVVRVYVVKAIVDKARRRRTRMGSLGFMTPVPSVQLSWLAEAVGIMISWPTKGTCHRTLHVWKEILRPFENWFGSLAFCGFLVRLRVVAHQVHLAEQ